MHYVISRIITKGMEEKFPCSKQENEEEKIIKIFD